MFPFDCAAWVFALKGFMLPKRHPKMSESTPLPRQCPSTTQVEHPSFCLNLPCSSQKIKFYTFLRPRIDPTKDGIPQGLIWESYMVLCEVARWHQLPNFYNASEPFCYLPWKTWGCGGTHGFSWRGGVLQFIQMSKITLRAWHYHRVVCLLDYIFSPRYRWLISFTVLLQFCWTPSRKTESYLISVYFFRPRHSDTNTLNQKKSVLLWKTPTPYKVKNKKTKGTK